MSTIIQLKYQYECCTTLILHKTRVRCIRNSCLNMLVESSKFLGRIAAHNFVQVDVNALNCAYYKVVRLTRRFEYPTALIFDKTGVVLIRSCCLNRLFKIFNFFCLITAQNFMKVNIITPNHAVWKIIQLTLR